MPIYSDSLVKFASALGEIVAIQTEIHQISAVIAIMMAARYALIAQAPLNACSTATL
jgi:hypothetical protein